MHRGNRFIILLCMLVPATLLMAGTEALRYEQQSLVMDGQRVQVSIPAGMQLELVSADFDSPRLITFAENGDLFMGSRSGHIYRVPPPYTKPEIILSMSGYPHNVAFRDGEILIAETGGLYRAPYQIGQKEVLEETVSLLAALPGGSGHNSRTVRVGSDGKIYASLGIQGNCSDQYIDESYEFQERRGGVFVLDESGRKPEWKPYASGLRNPVGFDWHPQTGVMYASNNGPDHLGFELPPEYFARLDPGSFQGMPWFQFDGKTLKRDPCIKSKSPRPAEAVSLPVATFPARNAPMGVRFVPTGALEKSLQHDAIVALKGSWGTQPSGGAFGDPASRRKPMLAVVRFKKGKALRVDPLVTGFQFESGHRWARPVGVAFGPDGALYFSSDSGINGLFRLKKR